MAFDTYMIIGDGSVVKGEATAADLKPAEGWFEIFSYSFGASNPTTVGTGSSGLSAGKVSVSSFNIMKRSEGASAALFTACCVGQHFDKAEIVLRKATGSAGKQEAFLTYEFKDVMVESIQWSGSAGGDDVPTESVSFAFAVVTATYFKQDTKTGKITKAGASSWDLTKAAKGGG